MDMTPPPEAPKPVPLEVVPEAVQASTAATIVETEAPKELVVVAKNPHEMMVAQARLISWADRRLREEQVEHADLTENLELAKKNKWRTTTLQRAVTRSLKRVEFCEKIKGALEAGYVIVPNMPVDVFAIRTTRRNPDKNLLTDNWRMPDDQVTNSPPLGQGEYHNSQALLHARQVVTKHEPGKEPVYTTQRWAHDFLEIDFPFATAKPEILSATAEALALRLFDDVSISPPRRNREVTRGPTTKGDPMVIGRVLLKNGLQTKAVSFLVAWFVDTRDL